jgi:cell division protein FtsL
MKSIIGMLVLLLVTLYVWQQIRVIQMGYEIEQLQRERRELYRLHQSLLIEAATLSSLDRIERIATTQLGLVRPQSGQVILVRRNSHDQMPSEKAVRLAQTKEGKQSRETIR